MVTASSRSAIRFKIHPCIHFPPMPLTCLFGLSALEVTPLSYICKRLNGLVLFASLLLLVWWVSWAVSSWRLLLMWCATLIKNYVFLPRFKIFIMCITKPSASRGLALNPLPWLKSKRFKTPKPSNWLATYWKYDLVGRCHWYRK